MVSEAGKQETNSNFTFHNSFKWTQLSYIKQDKYLLYFSSKMTSGSKIDNMKEKEKDTVRSQDYLL